MSDAFRKVMFRLASAKREVKTPEGLPSERHWLILIEDSYTPYSGYENEPGGGYSAQQPYTRVFAYVDRQVWVEDVSALTSAGVDFRQKWRAVSVEPAQIDVSVKVSVK